MQGHAKGAVCKYCPVELLRGPADDCGRDRAPNGAPRLRFIKGVDFVVISFDEARDEVACVRT